MKLTWKAKPIKPQTATYRWTANYAALVHNGGEIANHFGGGSWTYPARPWTTATIDNFSVSAIFVQEFNGDFVLTFHTTAETLGDLFKMTIDDYQWDVDAPRGEKQFRGGPTWETITDSGTLRDSQTLEFS